MPELNRQGMLQKWTRLALRCGLLFTDIKLWQAIRGQLRDRADDMGNEVRRRYADTSGRLDRAQNAYEGGPNWAAAAGFLGGIGVGVGVGMLLAPASGQETRTAIRNKVVELKKRVSDKESSLKPAAIRASSTGTGV
jgi:hypothetical protein